MEWISLDEETEAQILFHTQQVDFLLSDETLYQGWIEKIIAKEKKTFSEINYIFCDDAYLLEKNQTYLQHDTLTDIITFEYSSSPISGDIFISIERVRENAEDRNIPFEQELSRVMAHGVLHLCGYGDKKEAEVKVMREKEEACIAMFSK